MTTIYGIITEQNEFGVQGLAVIEDGTIIDTHFCSSESFAKSDLGFSEPVMSTDLQGDEHCTVRFNADRRVKYDALFPDGWQTLWLGYNHNIEPNHEKWEKELEERSKK